MTQAVENHSDYRARLDVAVTAFSVFIHDLCPDAHLEISFARYEDEDAHIWVTVPSRLSADEQDALANRMAERGLDVLLEEGLCILAGVDEPDERRERRLNAPNVRPTRRRTGRPPMRR